MVSLSKNASLFRRVASERFKDAEILLQHQRTTGAIYLAGYAVECSLKAMIIANVPRTDEEAILSTFRGSGGHEFDRLLKRYRDGGGASIPKEIGKDLSLVNSWEVGWRYESGQADPKDARDFLDAARRIVKWAEDRL